MTTIVFFHAHPDDEALLTGGTLAQLADRGHRVVLVTATAGEAGLADEPAGLELGARRVAELADSARLLGCARIELLGYPDSGLGAVPTPGAFAELPVAEPAGRLAEILIAESAEILVGYDPAGGYGHPDHVQVHRVARAAARLAGTPRLLEVTVDRRALQRALRLTAPLTRDAPDFRAARFADRYTAPEQITHRVHVGSTIERKRAAMRAHASQSTGDGVVRSLRRLLDLPTPVFRLVFGREWYVEVGAAVPRRPLGDVLLPATSTAAPPR